MHPENLQLDGKFTYAFSQGNHPHYPRLRKHRRRSKADCALSGKDSYKCEVAAYVGLVDKRVKANVADFASQKEKTAV